MDVDPICVAHAGRASTAAPSRVASMNRRLPIFFMSRLTPELSRRAERARRWNNLSASAETAKRARLERIVSCYPHESL